MKKAKQKPVSKAMRRLLVAQDPAEVQAALRQLRKAVNDVPLEKRDALYDVAVLEVRRHAINLYMKENPSPLAAAIYQELQLLKPQTTFDNLMWSRNIDALNTLKVLSPFQKRFPEVSTPEEAHQLIQDVTAQVSAEPTPKLRTVGYNCIVYELEAKILSEYRKANVEKNGDRHHRISSLISTLENMVYSSLTLAFLSYNSESDTFSLVSPHGLANIEVPSELRSALALYRIAIQGIDTEDVSDCGQELKKAILGRLMNWLDNEGLMEHRDINLCVDMLSKALGGKLFTGRCWRTETPETFGEVMETINSALYLGMEMDDDALDANCSDHAEALTKCFYTNRFLTGLTEFSLVCRILQAVKLLKVELPPTLECLIRVYLVMFLTHDYTLSDNAAFHWAVEDLPTPDTI